MAAQPKTFKVCDTDAPGPPRALQMTVASIPQLQELVGQVFRQPGFLSFKEPDGTCVIVTAQLNLKQLPNKLEWTHQPPEPQAAIQDYEVTPLTFKDFRFDAKLPQAIRIASNDAGRCGLISVPTQCQDILSIGSQCDALSLDATLFLRNQKAGTSEDAHHSRNDAIMTIIQRVSGGMPRDRNKKSTSTTTQRLGCWLGSPPLVLLEEKADPKELKVAKNEVHDMFCWLPHYNDIQFVIGIAIAGDLVQMFAISKQNVKWETTIWDLAVQTDCIRVLQAAVNVGRLCRFMLHEGLLPATRVDFNITHNEPGRSLLITCHHVEKTYKSMSELEQESLMRFYSDTEAANVEFLERAKVIESGRLLKLKLTPVGLERPPKDIAEAKVALKCILSALSECHKLGWTLNDLRWANVVVLQSGHWCVIDCEYARKIGALLPQQLEVRCDWTNRCSAATDLYMVGQLLKDLPAHLCSDAELGELQRRLLSKGECFDKELTAQQVLQDYEWLQQASPTGSPQGAAKVAPRRSKRSKTPARASADEKGKRQRRK